MKVAMLTFVMSVAVSVFLYVVVAGLVWQLNNPLGNQLTFWRYFGYAMQFKSLPQFQEKL